MLTTSLLSVVFRLGSPPATVSLPVSASHVRHPSHLLHDQSSSQEASQGLSLSPLVSAGLFMVDPGSPELVRGVVLQVEGGAPLYPGEILFPSDGVLSLSRMARGSVLLQTIHQCPPLLLPCLSSNHLPSEQTMMPSLLLPPLTMGPIQLLASVQSSAITMLSLWMSLVLLSPWWFLPPHLTLLGVLCHLLVHPCLAQSVLPLVEMTQSQSRLHLLQLLVMMVAPCLRPLALAQMTP